MAELKFPWKKVISIFSLIYNFTITLTRIHFPIYKVQINNLNPENTKLSKYFPMFLNFQNIFLKHKFSASFSLAEDAYIIFT